MSYRVILADPPWAYNDRRETRRDNAAKKPKFGLGVERRYSAGTMSFADLASLGPLVLDVAAPDAYCFMWATLPLLPGALDTLDAWGFRYVTTAFVWIKTTSRSGEAFAGPGRYTMSNAEVMLLGVRGKPWHPATGWKPKQAVLAPHPRDHAGKIIHSRKPAVFKRHLEDWLGPHCGQFLELFATEPGNSRWVAMGHAVTGNDIREDLRRRHADPEAQVC